MSTVLLRVTFDPTTKIGPLTVVGGDLRMTVARYLGRVTLSRCGSTTPRRS
jgi:hypothetical protein